MSKTNRPYAVASLEGAPMSHMDIIQYRWDGNMTTQAAELLLEGRKIRGSFEEGGRFVGYDYSLQQWIDYTPR